MRHLLAQAGLDGRVQVDSAGTGGWHAGEPPDRRATATAAARGITLGGRARQFTPRDFDRHDLILAMDYSNLRDLQRLAPDEQARAKVRRLREFDPGAEDLDVPDPYFGGARGFDDVLDHVQAACQGLLAEIRTRLS